MKIEQWGQESEVAALMCSTCRRVQFFATFPGMGPGLPAWATGTCGQPTGYGDATCPGYWGLVEMKP